MTPSPVKSIKLTTVVLAVFFLAISALLTSPTVTENIDVEIESSQ